MFEAALRAREGPLPIVYASSAAVYGDSQATPLTEDAPTKPLSAYGADKLGCEQHARAAAVTHGLGSVGMRFFNVYGPRQDYRGAYIAVIMKMLDAIDQGQGPTIMGDGSEAFDFVAVEDCAASNLCAMKADATDRFYNVGTGIRTSLRELTERICTLTGCNQPIQYASRSQATFVRNRIGGTRRAEEEIGFKAEILLDEGLRRLIAWRRADKAKARL